VIDRSIHGPSAYAEAALEPPRSIRLQFDLPLSRRSESALPATSVPWHSAARALRRVPRLAAG
jgi:hypothetical protein